jgi:phage shock protein C
MKRLYRSESDRIIAGVCGGLGEYFNVDPVIFRVIFVILLLPGGFPGFVPYVILWIIVPTERKVKKDAKKEHEA